MNNGTEPEPTPLQIDSEALLALLDQQSVQMGRQGLLITTLQHQLQLRDQQIAELSKAKPTKRTAAKKKT